ncbi:LA2681 family HEPN domain-containing protein [Bacillus toyonensis]
MDIQNFMEQADARIERADETEINEFLTELEKLLDTNKEDPYILCNLYYAKANHLSALKEAKINKDGQVLIEIGALEELHEQSIYCLRKALALSEKLEEVEPEFKAMMLTNLANEISHVGRFVEAIDIWDSAEKNLGSSFPMAIGNMGLGLTTYANYHYDPGHAHFLRREAFYRLQYAVEHKELLHSEYAYTIFKQYKDRIQEVYPDEFLKNKELYKGNDYNPEEKEYREWCLDNKLFLNPLNDVAKSSIADQDILGLPTIIVSKDQRYPVFHSYFNQLKQEYVTARWFLYDSLKYEMHFSDSQVGIYDTLDSQMFGLSVQKLKIAFKSTYSIFDKIAYFLNEYYKIGIPKNFISFKSIWYENLRANKLKVRKEIKFQKNGPLKGLYWLSKDLYYKGDIDYRNVIEPDAQKLDEIRNHLEHKFLDIHFPFYNIQGDKSLTESINEDELYERTIKLLKLSRAALIYLSLAIHIEEQNRKEMYAGKNIHRVKLDYIEDEDKNNLSL